MADIVKYLDLIKRGIISNLGQRCENQEGYYCTIIKDGKIVSAIIKITNDGTFVQPISDQRQQKEPEM